jgi:hypothetical protein
VWRLPASRHTERFAEASKAALGVSVATFRG